MYQSRTLGSRKDRFDDENEWDVAVPKYEGAAEVQLSFATLSSRGADR
jgi:hypothetical protein